MQVGAAVGWRARYAEAQLLALAGLAAQAPEQQFDHLQILRFGRVEQAALHRPARVAVEELGKFVGPVAVGVDMGAFDLVQDVLARQHLLRHLAVGDVDEGIELGLKSTSSPFRVARTMRLVPRSSPLTACCDAVAMAIDKSPD